MRNSNAHRPSPPLVEEAPGRVIRLPLRPGAARPGTPVVVVLGPDQHAWAEEVVSSPTMEGLECSVADVLRLGLEELRRNHRSRPRLERALRAHLWQAMRAAAGHDG